MVRSSSRMIRVPALFIAIVFAGAASLHAQSADWKSFGAANEGFHVLFPTAPEVTRSIIPAGSESFELRSYVAEVGTTALYVGVCDYGARGRAADPVALLDGAKKGAVDHVNAHILSEKKIELDSNPGVAFEAESDKLHFNVRMLLSQGLLYQVMVATPLNQTFADAGRFFDSFQLIPRPAALTSAPVPPEWKAYRYESDGFSASFPAAPNVQKQNITTDGGQFELRTYVAEDSSAALIAAVCDYGTSIAGKDPQTLLDSAKNGALDNLRAHMTTANKISLGDSHGLEFDAENESEHISGRIYLRGTNLYQVLVVSPLNSKYADTAHFLDSFQFRDKDAK